MSVTTLRENPRYRTKPARLVEQELANAQAIAARLTQVQAMAHALLARLLQSTPDDRPHLPPLRTESFDRYLSNSRQLVAFYRAVFDRTQPQDGHRPSQYLEDEMREAHEHYSATWDALHTDPLGEHGTMLRAIWLGALTTNGLAAFKEYHLAMTETSARIGTLTARVGAAVADAHPGEPAEFARQRTRMSAELASLAAFITTQEQIWSDKLALLGPGELGTFMRETQGLEGARRAKATVARQDVVLAELEDAVNTLLDQVTPRPVRTAVNDTEVALRLASERDQIRALVNEADLAVATAQSVVGEYARVAHQDDGPRRVTNTVEITEFDVTIDQVQPRVLLSLAHADDETTAGMLAAYYAEMGAEIEAVCATGGESGRVQTPAIDTPDGHRNFIRRRNHEFVESMRHLGVRRAVSAGFMDSGMANEPSAHPLRLATRQNARAYENLLLQRLVEFQPGVVVTHPPIELQRSYAHPDHAATWHATNNAVARYTALRRKTEPDFRAPLIISVDVRDKARHETFLPLNDGGQNRVLAARQAYETQIPGDAPGAVSVPDMIPTMELGVNSRFGIGRADTRSPSPVAISPLNLI